MNPISTEKSFRVGIMADSHGDAGAIVSALALFRDRGCDPIFHLGDICDSLRPESVDACIDSLRASGVRAVCGNNDHSILIGLREQPDPRVSEQSRSYLERLPLTVSYRDAELVHSLPLAGELGLASMIGSLESVDADRVFNSTTRRVVFRGHSHSPQVRWRRGGQARSLGLRPSVPVDLTPLMPCIVTCGALSDGFCLVWEPDRQVVTCLSLTGLS